MNDAGADEAVRDLAHSHANRVPAQPSTPTTTSSRFLSPTYQPAHAAHPKRHSRHNSDASSASSAQSQNSQKEKENSILDNHNNNGVGVSRPHRTSCFWERFSHDSREGVDEEDEEDEVENVRMSRGINTGSASGSVNSSSPMREPQEREGGLDGGDEEENMRELKGMEKRGQEDEQMPGLYFLLSTAFPLMSATLGPLANVMSICALVVPWRVFNPPSPTGTPPDDSFKIADPAWCLALNGISLACGFIANVILLLNLARRIQSTHLQPITITLWYIASFLLIALLAVYRKYLYHTPREEHNWSQAFYYAIIAASLYFVIATLLLMNYIGVLTGKYARQFTLTIVQRTLMLQTMSLMVWLCLGAGVFARLEGWAYLDGVYFCDTTLLVVGLGDYNLTTNAGRALLFPFAAVGVVTVGLIVSSIRGLVLERGKRKVERRLLEKQREVVVDGGKGGTEDEKERFELMRKAQDRADQRRKWMSLCSSVSFFLLFWMIGALVFMHAETEQNWNYFQSLYFCFTTILTIGYGDFHPVSNAGKPFFVIWSLLAVPMMTILVSNLGDTVIVIIKNVTLWLGEWTVLPEEKLHELGGRNRWLKTETQRRKHERLQHSERFQEYERQRKQKQRDFDEQLGDTDDEAEEKKELQRIGGGLVNKEEKEDQEHRHEDSNGALFHDLAFAIQKLLPDLAQKGSRQYSYEEWHSYLKLIYMPTPSERSRSQGQDDQEGVKRDWLGENSPLMSRQSETEWLLTKLCGRLEECLREEKETTKRRGKGKQKEEAPAGRSGY